MQYLEEQTLNWKSMAWRVFQRKIWKREEEYLNKKHKVLLLQQCYIDSVICLFLLVQNFLFFAVFCVPESQKKKQNQDDSDEYDEDEEPGPSFQQPAAQPQAGYMPPMTQPGMPPGSSAPGMPPGSYSGREQQWVYINLFHVRVINVSLW